METKFQGLFSLLFSSFLFFSLLFFPLLFINEKQTKLNQTKPNRNFNKVSAYVMQDDKLFETMTPRELLSFSASLRLPRETTKEEKKRKEEKEEKRREKKRKEEKRDLGTLFPFRRIVPEVSLILLERQLRREVFPPPEGPIIERSSPGFASPETSLRMSFIVICFLKGGPLLISLVTVTFLHSSFSFFTFASTALCK